MMIKFCHRSLKNRHKTVLWRSQFSSCIERHRLHLMTFLKKSSWTAWSITFWNHHRISSGPRSPTQGHFLWWKRHKHRHRFNCHVIHRCNGGWHVHWHIRWHGNDVESGYDVPATWMLMWTMMWHQASGSICAHLQMAQASLCWWEKAGPIVHLAR